MDQDYKHLNSTATFEIAWNLNMSYKREIDILKKNLTDNGGRRSNIDRRCVSYDMYIPERRQGIERRDSEDRRQQPRSLNT